MRIQFSKIAFLAGFVLAMVFTFSCSSGGGGSGDGGWDNPSGGGVPFNENSQIYDREDGTLYKGSGIIKMPLGEDEDGNEILMDAGSVTDGIVNLKLPTTIPDKYLTGVDKFDDDCFSFPKGTKMADGHFILTTADNDNYLRLWIGYSDEQIIEGINYLYFTKAGKITCKSDNEEMNIDAKAGWNKIYLHCQGSREHGYNRYFTNNILTKEVKWTIN
ncbi:MAG: hypothetical protein LBC87_05245 [Fibromonadaceae bacterium]|jgi:hypothetical protein|nr:hypothetical protein [Fibromonadaceae bacterium]